MTTKKEDTTVLGEGLQRLEDRRKLAEELGSRVFKTSELRELREDARGDVKRMEAIERAIRKIEQEGRIEDDERPSYANKRRRFGEGVWLVRRATISLLSAFAAHLDEERRNAPPRQTGAPAPPAPLTYAQASNAFLGKLALPIVPANPLRVDGADAAEHRISEESHLGTLFAQSAPRWVYAKNALPLTSKTGKTDFVEGTPEGYDLTVADYQGLRWAYLSHIWLEVLDAFRTGAAEPPFPMLEGMDWVPHTVENFPLVDYRADNRALKTFVEERARAAIQRRRDADAERRRTELATEYARAG